MRRCLALAFGLLGCGRIGFEPGAPLLADGAGSTLVIDRVGAGEVLRDFPLLVVLDDTRLSRADLRDDGSDLRFLDEAGTTLAHELTQVGSAGGVPLIAWVKVPEIRATTTTVFVRYGQTSPATSASGRVWNDGYVAVWHLDADDLDATGHGHSGVRVGGTTVAGLIGGGVTFAPGGAIHVTDGPGLAVPRLTVSAWVYERTHPSGAYTGLVTRQRGSGGSNDFFLGNRDGKIYGAFIDVGGTIAEIAYSSVAGPAPLRWQHFAATVDGAALSVYLDGGLVEVAAAPREADHSPRPVIIGADVNDPAGTLAETTDGVIDEVRLEQVARSAEWIAADYTSSRDQLIDYGPVER